MGSRLYNVTHRSHGPELVYVILWPPGGPFILLRFLKNTSHDRQFRLVNRFIHNLMQKCVMLSLSSFIICHCGIFIVEFSLYLYFNIFRGFIIQNHPALLYYLLFPSPLLLKHCFFCFFNTLFLELISDKRCVQNIFAKASCHFWKCKLSCNKTSLCSRCADLLTWSWPWCTKFWFHTIFLLQ